MLFGFCIHCVFFCFLCELCQQETGSPDIRVIASGDTSTTADWRG
jgi:hypothetical protein